MTLVVATLVVIGGLGALSAAIEAVPTARPTAGPNVPPAGEIWFGDSADSATLQVGGHTARLKVDEPYAMVIHLTKVMDVSALAVQISVNGRLIGSEPFRTFLAKGVGEMWAFQPGEAGFPGAGVWTVEILDSRTSDVLASGTVTVNP